MEDLKTYLQWCPILELESGMKIVDDDGSKALAAENKTDALLSKREAYEYFYRNTMVGMSQKKR